MFLFELSKKHSYKYNIFFLVPHTKGAKLKEVWQNITIYRFRYFWPQLLKRLSHRNSGMYFALKSNKFLYLLLPFLIFFQLVNMIRFIKKEKIDIIHAHWLIPFGFSAALVAKIFRKPLIVSDHGSDLNLSNIF
jgi:predicted neutral ceramidase superfamily lipid hydrolase